MVVRILEEEENEEGPLLNQVVSPELAELIKSTIQNKVVKVTRAVSKAQRHPNRQTAPKQTPAKKPALKKAPANKPAPSEDKTKGPKKRTRQ
jgi:hypothetical protein